MDHLTITAANNIVAPSARYFSLFIFSVSSRLSSHLSYFVRTSSLFFPLLTNRQTDCSAARINFFINLHHSTSTSSFPLSFPLNLQQLLLSVTVLSVNRYRYRFTVHTYLHIDSADRTQEVTHRAHTRTPTHTHMFFVINESEQNAFSLQPSRGSPPLASTST